jgi:hypothetical protein
MLKLIDDDSGAALNRGASPMSIDFGSRPLAAMREPTESIWFKALMRFGLYLMLVAFLIMGAEVVYALYQLAGLIL